MIDVKAAFDLLISQGFVPVEPISSPQNITLLDVKTRTEIQKDRLRIITKMMEEKKKGGTVIKPSKKQQLLYHCDTMEE